MESDLHLSVRSPVRSCVCMSVPIRKRPSAHFFDSYLKNIARRNMKINANNMGMQSEILGVYHLFNSPFTSITASLTNVIKRMSRRYQKTMHRSLQCFWSSAIPFNPHPSSFLTSRNPLNPTTFHLNLLGWKIKKREAALRLQAYATPFNPSPSSPLPSW